MSVCSIDLESPCIYIFSCKVPLIWFYKVEYKYGGEAKTTYYLPNSHNFSSKWKQNRIKNQSQRILTLAVKKPEGSNFRIMLKRDQNKLPNLIFHLYKKYTRSPGSVPQLLTLIYLWVKLIYSKWGCCSNKQTKVKSTSFVIV